MQSHTQEQPLALTTVKPHYPTNGKEEEVNTGKTLHCFFNHNVARVVSCCSPHQINRLERLTQMKMRLRNLTNKTGNRECHLCHKDML